MNPTEGRAAQLTQAHELALLRGFTAAYRDIRDDRGPRELVVDKTTWPGASGSPIYLENGMVIGILLQP